MTRVLLFDDELGKVERAPLVGELFDAASVVNAESGELLARCGESYPALAPHCGAEQRRSGEAAFDPIEIWVCTAQEGMGEGVRNSPRLVERVLASGWPFASQERWALVLIDLMFLTSRGGEHLFGTRVFQLVQQICPELRAVAFSDLPLARAEAALDEFPSGAFAEYVPKTPMSRAKTSLRRALRDSGLVADLGGPLKGNSLPWMTALRTARGRASQRNSLLVGAIGCGKEGLARYIHDWSARTGEYLAMSLSAGASDAQLVALFGSASGRLTGVRNNPGYFELAQMGTVFLDELHNSNEEAQGRLLDALAPKDDGRYYTKRLGGTTRISIEVATIAATNLSDQDIACRMLIGSLRSDLLDRLDIGHCLRIPGLAQRADDIPQLVEHFVAAAEREAPDRMARQVAPDTIDTLKDCVVSRGIQSVRWLENTIRDAIGRYPRRSVLRPEHLDLAGITLPGPDSQDSGRKAESSSHDKGHGASSAITTSATANGIGPEVLRGVILDLDRGYAERSAAAYVRLWGIYRQRARVVRELFANDQLKGYQIDDRLAHLASLWLAAGIEMPEDVQSDIAKVLARRRRRS